PAPSRTGRTQRIVLTLCLLLPLLAAGCATTPTGRRQLKLVSPQKMQQMGDKAYVDIKKETPEVENEAIQDYVRCVCTSVTSALPGRSRTKEWEITVFSKDDAINAFALPGGNIGVYTGLLDVAETPDQLAAVVSHEVAHVRLEHANARISANYATQIGVSLVGAVLGGGEEGNEQLYSLLGLGAQVGVLLPYNRSQESEADLLGLEYMAAAGFDPEASVALWRNMKEASGEGPSEFLSTHPSKGTRIQTLQKNLPRARKRYKKAQNAGRNPDCRPPDKRE
ncbi:MAG: M48 family metallopeptidase, partial [Desulfohalobiaceae bacterium]